MELSQIGRLNRALGGKAAGSISLATIARTSPRFGTVSEAVKEDPMSDFVLEISGAGEAITLEPIGCVDRQGALTLIEAVESVQSARRTPLLEIRTDRITGCTADAAELLARNDLPDLALAG
jgi:hypothetical protein